MRLMSKMSGLKIRATIAAAAVLSTGLVANAAPASALVDCAARTMTRPFSPWGDTNQYFQVTNAGFDSYSSGWSGTGQIANENEPWRILGGTTSRSYSLSPGQYVASSRFCVTPDEDSIRFFVKRPAILNSKLTIKMEVLSSPNHIISYYTLTSTPTTGGWAVTPRIPLPMIIGTSGTQDVNLTFTSNGTPGLWRIDDIMVDPWRSR